MQSKNDLAPARSSGKNLLDEAEVEFMEEDQFDDEVEFDPFSSTAFRRSATRSWPWRQRRQAKLMGKAHLWSHWIPQDKS